MPLQEMFKTRETLLWNHFYSWGQCLWIVKILLVCGDIILWVIGLLHYINTWQFTTLVNIREDVNLWVRVAHKIHEHWSQIKMIPQYILPYFAIISPWKSTWPFIWTHLNLLLLMILISARAHWFWESYQCIFTLCLHYFLPFEKVWSSSDLEKVKNCEKFSWDRHLVHRNAHLSQKG